MLRAIIFDFDGVIADSEPAHFAALQKILAEIGVPLTEREYYEQYLGYDDKGCFAAALRAHGRPAPAPLIEALVARKAAAYLDHIRRHLVLFPGVREFAREAARRCRLAIASGALRHEIEFILEEAGLRKEFEHITSAEDVQRGKPDPEPYLHALAALNTRAGSRPPLHATDCLVIEDSLPGIRAAHAAGMRVLAVTNTHPPEDLQAADVVTASLQEVSLPALERRLWGSGEG